jgi:2-polyprenyl-3-methyl-5-hydroxy-6-metoxy-1,4-benzoquinol methylase
MKVKDKFIWDIEKFDEEANFLEAVYIDAIIKFAAWKNCDNYRKILDIPCGFGRLHKYLREFGYEVWGIDYSEELIREAKKKFPEHKDFYIRCDMRDLREVKEKFDVVLNWFTSFGYFSEKENFKVLRNFHRA